MSGRGNVTDRLSQHDPAGAVNLENPGAVLKAIKAMLDRLHGSNYDSSLLTRAVGDLVLAFRGDYPGLLRCDTLYHDLRHSLETGLTTTRLLDGHARSLHAGSSDAIDAEHALLSVLLALFHDVGLLRRDTEGHLWGPVLTPVHEERGVEFMVDYLARTSLAALAEKAELIMATKLVFTMPDSWAARDRKLASIVASADLMGQMSDRCYLEKCRDFLFLEFSAFGLAGTTGSPYPDRETLLLKTPGFVEMVVRDRLEREFNSAHRYMEFHSPGHNPWQDAIGRNLSYLAEVLQSGSFERLRRVPRPFIGDRNLRD